LQELFGFCVAAITESLWINFRGLFVPVQARLTAIAAFYTGKGDNFSKK